MTVALSFVEVAVAVSRIGGWIIIGEPMRTSTVANSEYRCKVSLSDRMPNLNLRPSIAPASAMTAKGRVMEVRVEATARPFPQPSQFQKIAYLSGAAVAVEDSGASH
jgi:hypothetical protein